MGFEWTRRTRAAHACLLASALLACGESSKRSNEASHPKSGSVRIEPETPADEPKAEPPASPASKEERKVAGDGTFDLAAGDDGAWLAWAPPWAEGGGVFVQRLDAYGGARAAARRVVQTDASTDVLEVAATSRYGRAGLVWVESSKTESRTRSLLLTPDGSAAGEERDLTVGPASQVRGRRRIALGRSRGETMRTLYAMTAEDCGRGSSEVCSGYGFSKLGDDDGRGVDGEWLRVPQPCSDVAPMLAGATGELYYAVCSDADGQRTTTAFAINLTDEYARAVEVLPGCTPRGLVAPLWGAAWIVGRCPQGLRAARLTTSANHALQEHTLDDLRATCVDGQLTLRAGDLSLPLSQPLDGLEALLPPKLAPENAVAAFTGHTLLIARNDEQTLRLDRYDCSSGQLAPAPQHTTTGR